MTIPIALTLVAVSVAAIASIMVAVLKLEVDSLKLKNDRLHDDLHLEKKRVKECESGFNSISDALAKSEFEIVKLKAQLTKATLTNAELSEALKAANTQVSIDSLNAKAARAISRDLSSDVVKLQAQLSTSDKAYDLLVKELDTTKRKRGANGQYLKK
jgi:chromosome segregation ATPase